MMDLSLGLVVLFLAAALFFYALLGGADFGAGIVEACTPKALQKKVVRVVGKAMGPVWEANHMWIVLAVVILFNGFPRAYAWISTSLHVPLTVMLIGIILRGTAFTFRHYDAFEEEGSQHWYQRVFAWSSVLVPLMLGMMAAAMMDGLPLPETRGTYAELYLLPWWHGFGLAVGVFLAAMSSLAAAVFLAYETDEDVLRRLFKYQARLALLIAVVAGGLVLFGLGNRASEFRHEFWSSSLAMVAIVGASLLFVPLWWGIGRLSKNLMRVLVGSLWLLVFVAWFAVQAPWLVRAAGGAGDGGLTFVTAAAPEVTLRALLGALLVGSLVIFPFLAYLFNTFKFAGTSHPFNDR